MVLLEARSEQDWVCFWVSDGGVVCSSWIEEAWVVRYMRCSVRRDMMYARSARLGTSVIKARVWAAPAGYWLVERPRFW